MVVLERADAADAGADDAGDPGRVVRELVGPACLAELSQIIEDEYGVKLKGEDVGKIKTVGDAVDLVVQRAG